MTHTQQQSLITLAIILLLGGLGVLYWYSNETGTGQSGRWICQDGTWVKEGNPTSTPVGTCATVSETPMIQIKEGRVATRTTDHISIVDETTSDALLTARIDNGTTIKNSNGTAIDITSIRPGFIARVKAEKAGDSSWRAQEITLTREINILVKSPEPGELINNPVTVNGEARTFENTYLYRIKDGNGNVLAEDSGIANAPDVGQFGSFTPTINYKKPSTPRGVIEVFESSAKDGSEINKVIIPVMFSSSTTMNVKVYFSNSKKDPNVLDCNNVYSVTREIPKTQASARAALEELLKGPTSEDANAGFFTNINPGVNILSLVIKDRVAYVNLSEKLEQGVSGSCKVEAIRAQISHTLTQFPTVGLVVLSINGRTEDILQP